MNRWCIIATPRSGSTWLEESIYQALPESCNKLSLGEFFHGEFLKYQTLTSNIHIKSNWATPNRIKFYNEALDIIKKTDRGITLRIFPQSNYFEHNYIGFVEDLAQHNFNFIKLTRDIFDRVISLCVAQSSDVWHRIYETPQKIVHRIGTNPVYITPDNKIKIKSQDFVRNFLEAKAVDYFFEELTSKVDCFKIEYKTLKEDCVRLGIPFLIDGEFLKTYNEDYSDLIENYQELVDLFNNLNEFIKK